MNLLAGLVITVIFTLCLFYGCKFFIENTYNIKYNYYNCIYKINNINENIKEINTNMVKLTDYFNKLVELKGNDNCELIENTNYLKDDIITHEHDIKDNEYISDNQFNKVIGKLSNKHNKKYHKYKNIFNTSESDKNKK